MKNDNDYFVQPAKFKNKYRIEPARLPQYDYSNQNIYFVTICTKNKKHFFGKIENYKMHYSDLGNIANKCWKQIPNHFPFVKLENFIVMPNHIHGILIIHKNTGAPKFDASTNQHHYWKPGNLGVIMNQYKRQVTIESKKINPDFCWQPRFFDHILRSEFWLKHFSKYIAENPQNWGARKNLNL